MSGDQNNIKAVDGSRSRAYFIVFCWSALRLIVIISLGVYWAQVGAVNNIWCLTFALAVTFFLQTLVRFSKEFGIIKTDLYVRGSISLFMQIFIYPILCTVALFFVANLFIEEKSSMLMYIGIFLYVSGLLMIIANFLHKISQESNLKRDLEQIEQTSGNSPIMARDLNKLATIYFKQRKFSQAEPLYKRALAIYENTAESDINRFSVALDCLAVIYIKQRKFNQAELLLQRCITLNEPLKEQNISLFAQRKGTLAGVYGMQKKYTESESLYKDALAMFESDPKQSKPKFSQCLKGYSNTLRGMNRFVEAKECLARANAIK